MDNHFERQFAGLITNLILPAFIFCEILKNFDINNHKLIFEIILGCFTVSFLGLILGYLTAILCKSGNKETMFLCGVMSSPHTTSLPLILIEVLYPVLKNFRSGIVQLDPSTPISLLDAKERGMLYIVLNSIFSNIWRWAISYNLIQPVEKPRNEYLKIDNIELEENLLDKNFKKVDINSKSKEENIDNIEIELNLINNKKKPKKQGFWNIFRLIINTPIIISILSIILCINDNIRNAFIAKNSILADNFLSVNSIIARCYNFTIIFILGLNFSNLSFFNEDNNSINNPDFIEEELFSKTKIIIITIMKLIVFPLVGCPIIYYFRSQGLINDDILIFLLMFMLAAPNAINIIIVCSVKRSWLKNISLIVMVTYLFSVITLTFAITLFLYILS